MAAAGEPGKQGTDDSDAPSNNLRVGNLASDITDGDLRVLFTEYGALDITMNLSLGYASVLFKRVEDAAEAKEILQGALLRGNPVKIEFAQQQKPCKNILSVGGISQSVLKEEIEEKFLGKMEDASQEMRNMNRKRLGGHQIHADFLRSQRSGRELWFDHRAEQFVARNMGPAYPLKRQQRKAGFHCNCGCYALEKEQFDAHVRDMHMPSKSFLNDEYAQHEEGMLLKCKYCGMFAVEVDQLVSHIVSIHKVERERETRIRTSKWGTTSHGVSPLIMIRMPYGNEMISSWHFTANLSLEKK